MISSRTKEMLKNAKFTIGTYINAKGFYSLDLFLFWNNLVSEINMDINILRDIMKVLKIDRISFIFQNSFLKSDNEEVGSNLDILFDNGIVSIAAMRPTFYFHKSFLDQEFISIQKFFEYARSHNIEGYDGWFFMTHSVKELLALGNSIPRVLFNEATPRNPKFIVWFVSGVLNSILVGKGYNKLKVFSFDDLVYSLMVLRKSELIGEIIKQIYI